MNQPTPAIVPQSAVRRLPRLALLLFCLAYVIPGFIGREPWKTADMTAFGYMSQMAAGATSWFDPRLLGLPPELDGLLPYWLGAWALKAAPAWMAPDFAARIPFALMLALTLVATWYAVYWLARSPRAQPVPFAFGGEADPTDYARAMGDAGLLALIACLGLAQLSHETTPALAQVCFTAIAFYGVAALPHQRLLPAIAVVAGLAGLAFSGAPAVAVLFGIGCAVLLALPARSVDADAPARDWRPALLVAVVTLAAAALASGLDLWRWRIELPDGVGREWRSVGRLLLWFPWPAWPLALWTLWRWRRQLTSRHVALPLWFALVAVGTTMATSSSDRSLMLALPALAALAAFALPTFQRSASALIDWFTLLFFSGCAFVIWVVWIAMQTGVPHQPAANVARLAPGFEPSFSLVAFVAALAATVAWAWLVKWRAGRHRAAIWKSLVLPAGGAALSWLLLLTLWLPLLDFARSYAPLVRNVSRMLDPAQCVEVYGMSRGQIAAFQYHGHLMLRQAEKVAACPSLIVDDDAQAVLPQHVDMRQWILQATVRRPSDANENILLYKRAPR